MLGQQKNLPDNLLSLEVDIFNYMKKRIIDTKDERRINETKGIVSISSIADEVAVEVILLWKEKVNLPTRVSFLKFWAIPVNNSPSYIALNINVSKSLTLNRTHILP